ncbi:hypothetical protein [Acidovorax sp. Root568]|nr:hypothetical protein [Acidovorax sp. Root568]
MHALQTAATAPWVQTLALLCLCAAYLQGGMLLVAWHDLGGHHAR